MNELVNVTSMTSMEIAEITGKRHDNIMADIRDEIKKLTEGGISGELKFQLSSRKSEQNKDIPYYELSREGVLQLAARYDAVVRAKLIDMVMKREEQKPMCLEDVLIAQLQEMKAVKQTAIEAKTESSEAKAEALEAKKESSELKAEFQGVRDIISLDTTSWREATTAIINKIAQKLGGNEHIRDVRREAYELLDKRMGIDLQVRLTNKRRRMAEEGVCKSKRDRLNQLDVITEDKKLIEGFVAIIKEMAVKYGVA